MWRHSLTWPAFAVSKNKNHCECRNTSIHVNNGATSEVKCTALEQPTIRAKYPVSNCWVHNHAPHANQHGVCGELQTICCCASDECWRDDSEHHLKCKEHHDGNNKSEVAGVARKFGDGAEIFQEQEIKVADVCVVAAECE